MTSPDSAVRVLCYAQHLTGVGHLVRMRALARGLSRTHEVHLVDGGRPVPHDSGGSEPAAVRLPPLVRRGGDLAALEPGSSISAVLDERCRLLVAAVERMRPDVILIDHYPFSKWELEAEITGAIAGARKVNPAVRVLCSLRDVARQTRHEDADPQTYGARVLTRLAAYFDGIIVHTDPDFTRLDEHFLRCADIPVPVAYTGFVVDDASEVPPPSLRPPFAVLSCGGAAAGRAFLIAAMDAFARLAAMLGSMELIVFPGAFAERDDVDALTVAARHGRFRIQPFGPEFGTLLPHAALSISRAGYNTCAALLRAQTPAVLVPDPAMSDQGFRARRLAERGLAQVVAGEPLDAEALMAAMRSAVAHRPPRHDFDLAGVARTRALIETLEQWTRKEM